MLRITEIFHSLQGEADAVGWPTVFVRLTGCPLRCRYCDTAYAFHGGRTVSIVDVLTEVATHSARHVCVTGGEPLAQAGCLTLLTALCDAGYHVSLETSGALDITTVDSRVHIVMDLKAPASGESSRNLWSNISTLADKDQVKIVVCDRADYEWARSLLADQLAEASCQVMLSPAWGEMDPAVLAQWILDDHLPIRFQVQLHKFLWGEAPGR